MVGVALPLGAVGVAGAAASAGDAVPDVPNLACSPAMGGRLSPSSSAQSMGPETEAEMSTTAMTGISAAASGSFPSARSTHSAPSSKELLSSSLSCTKRKLPERGAAACSSASARAASTASTTASTSGVGARGGFRYDCVMSWRRVSAIGMSTGI